MPDKFHSQNSGINTRPTTIRKKNGVNKTPFTPKHTHQEENNLEISQNNDLRCL